MKTPTCTAARDTGIETSRRRSGEAWHSYALYFVKNYLIKNPTLFVDDLWEEGLSRPPSPRALGSVMQEAAKLGWMRQMHVPHGIVCRPSARSNGTPKPVWESLIYREVRR